MFVRPYLKSMSRSEINIMMTTGIATVAGGVLAAYVGFGIDAGHLISATLMSIPGAIVIAKIIEPETTKNKSKNELKFHGSAMKSTPSGSLQGCFRRPLSCLRLQCLLLFLVLLLIIFFKKLAPFLIYSLSFQDILGFIFRPIAFLIGIPWNESSLVGGLLGERMVLNGVSYMHLGIYERRVF